MARDWKFTHMSVAGPRHLAHGSACEDASRAFWHERGECIVLVSADGAGSAQYAGEAAALAVESASTSISAGLSDDPTATVDPGALQESLRAAAMQARIAIDRIADERGEGIGSSDFATTLLVSIWSDSLLGALQIGDGHIVTMSRDSVLDAVFRPTKGRYVNETCFLTSFDSFNDLDASGEVQTTALDATDTFGVALISDGLEPLFGGRISGRHSGFFVRVMHRLWQDEIAVFEENVRDFLSNSARLREVSDDDKTLAVAVRTNVPNLLDHPTPTLLDTDHPPSPPAPTGGGSPKVIPLDGSS